MSLQKKYGIEKLISLTKKDMGLVNELIIQRTLSDTDMIPKISQHLISSGGKRLRPMLTIASSKLCECRNNNYIPLAAGVEFMHTATLLHDDVVDDSEMRRGKIAARMLWGNEASVLVGDYLLGEAFKMMVEAQSIKALEVLSNAATVIAEGEVMQLVHSNHLTISSDMYFQIIDYKTAKLFSAATEIGAIISESSQETADILRDFGTYLGIAFQLSDDALDYSSTIDNIGKDIGDDFFEGKVTYPVIISYKDSSETEKKMWEKLIHKKNKSPDDFKSAIDLINEKGGIEGTLLEAQKYGEKALMCLKNFENSEMKKALIEAVYFSYTRNS